MAAGIGGFILLLTRFGHSVWALKLIPHFNMAWVSIALGNEPRNWFYPSGQPFFFLLAALGLWGAVLTLIQRRFQTAFFAALIFLICLYIYAFHFAAPNYLARYTFPLHLWAIPLLAWGRGAAELTAMVQGIDGVAGAILDRLARQP